MLRSAARDDGVPPAARSLRLLRRCPPVGRGLVAELFSQPAPLLASGLRERPRADGDFVNSGTVGSHTHRHLDLATYAGPPASLFYGAPAPAPAPARASRRRYKPCALRPQVDTLPDWVRYSHLMLARRRGQDRQRDRELHFLALAFFSRLVLKHWRNFARRQRALRPLLRRLLRRAALRGPWLRWRTACACERLAEIRDAVRVRRALLDWRDRVGLLRAGDRALERRASLVASRAALRTKAALFQRWLERLRAARRREVARGVLARLVRGCASSLLKAALRRWKEYLRRLAETMATRRLKRIAGRAAARAARMRRFARVLAPRVRRAMLRAGLRRWRRGIRRPRRRKYGPRGGTYCDCVQEVLRFGRCSCSPAAHLLKRLEYLHDLAAHADASHAVRRHRRLPVLAGDPGVAWEAASRTGGLPEWDPSRSYVKEYVRRRDFERSLDVRDGALEDEGGEAEEEYCLPVGEPQKAPRRSADLYKTHNLRRGRLSHWD